MTLVEEISKRTRARRPVNSLCQPPPSKQSNDDGTAAYTIAICLSLFVVNATLTYVARLQYHQDVSMVIAAKEAVVAIPVFATLIYFVHPISGVWPNLAGAVAGSLIGCYIVYQANEYGYYAAMSTAPTLATLWTWLLIELDWHTGLVTLIITALFVYFSDYSFL